MRVSRAQAVAHRMRVNHLHTRLPFGAYEQAAHVGLQDSCPRSALLSLHARVSGCEPDGWADPRLMQTYSPRAAAYVLPRKDFGVFTLGRLPVDPEERRGVEARAEQVCAYLDGRSVRGRDLPKPIADILRFATCTGRIAIYWDARSMSAFEVPRPDVDVDDARLELCRRHVHAFGPTTAAAFAWWAGLTPRDAAPTWRRMSKQLLEVDYEGRPAVILRADEAAMSSAPPVEGVRLLPSEDMRLLSLFARAGSPPQDTFHPHALVVDGQVAGRWGRKQGRVVVKLDQRVSQETRKAIEAEALTMPVPNASMTVQVLPEP